MKKFIIFTLFLVLIFVFSIFNYSIASFGEPGSAEDPIVTKSYVIMLIEELKEEIYLNFSGEIPEKSLEMPREKASNNKFVVVNIEKSKQFVAQEGTEFIVRSGKATAVGSELGGLSNVTDGRDITSMEEIPLNHLIIVPRDDGRGFIADTNLVVMVKGNYTIQ